MANASPRLAAGIARVKVRRTGSGSRRGTARRVGTRWRHRPARRPRTSTPTVRTRSCAGRRPNTRATCAVVGPAFTSRAGYWQSTDDNDGGCIVSDIPLDTRSLRRAAACCVLLVVVACSAQMVSKPGSTAPVPNAPVNEAERGGVVKYLNEGIQAVRDKRRASAYKQMAKACGGPYRIDAEGPQVEGGVVVPLQNGTAISTNTNDWYIQFSCVRADSSAPPRQAPTPTAGRRG